MKILTTDDIIKNLEVDLEFANSMVIKTAKRCNYKIIGKFFRNRLQTEKTFRDLIWYELREVTRASYPDQFIKSGGN